MHKQGEQSFILWIKKRIENNLNLLLLTQGSTGIGKSWVELRMAYDIDNTFEIRQVAFTFREVMEILNSDWFYKKKWKIILFDEAQTDISNRQWQSLSNKLMNYLLSTFRHRNIILLFTSPYSDFLDSQSMKLMHVILDCKGWNKKTKKSLVRPKLLQYNSKLKKFYEHSLFVIKDGKTNKLINWWINKPPEHLIKPYEEKKLEFTTKLNKMILAELTSLETGEVDTEKKGELNPDSMQPILWTIAQKGYTTQPELAVTLGKELGRVVKIAQLSKNIMSMRRKGYDIRKYKHINTD